MIKLNQRGALNVLIFPLVAVILLLIGAVCFGYWAFSGRQDYKDNVAQKVAVATTAALKVEDAKKDAQFAEASKYPLKAYAGPANYGSLRVSYPKTWSAYIDNNGSGTAAIDGYFYPDFVPSTDNQSVSYALRVQIVNQSYSSSLQQLVQQAQAGTLTATPYSLPKVKGVVGTRLEGALSQTKKGTMIMMPLRDKTLQIWTEAAQFETDFNNNVLPNVTFSP